MVKSKAGAIMNVKIVSLIIFISLLLNLDGICPDVSSSVVNLYYSINVEEESGINQRATNIDADDNCLIQSTLINGPVRGFRQTSSASNSDVDVFLGVSC